MAEICAVYFTIYIILMECNEKYKNAYKLTNAAKVKQHLEVIEEIANEIDSSNKEQS